VLEDPVPPAKSGSTGAFRTQTQKHMIFRAASDVSENQTKPNKNEECESDGSQKSIWRQSCQPKNVVERVQPGNGEMEPAPHPPVLLRQVQQQKSELR